MAVINTGIVERNITGVNESDLWLDTEATSSVSNTGAVERSITGVHDANFVRPLGDEEIVNGDFSTDSWWTLGQFWSIANGFVTRAVVGSELNYSVSRSNLLTIGKSYKVEIDVNSVDSGSVKVVLGSTNSTEYTSDGVYIFEGVCTSSTNFKISPSNDFNGSIDNVSIKEMLVTRESTATNTGIVERGVTGFNESIAFRQDTRTNLIPYSEDFSNAYWTKSGASVISGFSSPSADAPLGAFKLVANASNANIISRPQLISNTANTNSIYLKRVLGTGIVSIFNAAGNETVVTLTNEWQRFSTSISVNPSNAYHGVRVYDLGDEVMVFGAQTEQLSYSTSYIPTSGAVVTIDSNSTSVVNNTGIVERPIVGVNESDEMFPDNTISNIVNIAGLISSLIADLKARATTFENEDATQEILINLQKC